MSREITVEMIRRLKTDDDARTKHLERQAVLHESERFEIKKPPERRVLWTTNTNRDGVHRRGPTRSKK